MYFAGANVDVHAAQQQPRWLVAPRRHTDVQVLDLQHLVRHGIHLRSTGSSDSRSPSPSALKPSTVTTMAVMGKPSSHGV